ncbi:hypothetical protein HanPSC8_Chr02g0070801 [Helianthus annuus]|nr:hypothetical protein HanPSC8_Chr02g0070801 [Helianthus annuus]
MGRSAFFGSKQKLGNIWTTHFEVNVGIPKLFVEVMRGPTDDFLRPPLKTQNNIMFFKFLNDLAEIRFIDEYYVPNVHTLGMFTTLLLAAASVSDGVHLEFQKVTNMASGLGCRAGDTPFKYLGIQVGANMSRIANWDPAIEVFKNRLSAWKVKVLSIGGRVVLIKSVLESLPVYYFSLYKAPVTVVNKLEALIKRFLWGGTDEVHKVHWVAWSKVTKSKQKGGLGLNKLEDNNNALLLKWLWRYQVERGALWRKVVDSVHGAVRRWEIFPCNKSISGTWNKIVTFGYRLKNNGMQFVNVNTVHRLVGNGKEIKFWLDPWLSSEPLKNHYAALFRIEENKRCIVAERITTIDGIGPINWAWKRYPTMDVEVHELLDCHKRLLDVRIIDKQDGWVWDNGSISEFLVKEARKWLANEEEPSSDIVYSWCK